MKITFHTTFDSALIQADDADDDSDQFLISCDFEEFRALRLLVLDLDQTDCNSSDLADQIAELFNDAYDVAHMERRIIEH